MSDSPFRGLTAAEAMSNLAANTSAWRCPTSHRNAVAVEDVSGECVAALCPDCDEQLPASWAPEPERDFEAEHHKDHHGYRSVFLLGCRLCAEECA